MGPSVSVWGKSFGSAWGSSWGLLENIIAPPAGFVSNKDIFKRRPIPKPTPLQSFDDFEEDEALILCRAI